MKISGAIITLLCCVILVKGQNGVSFLEPNCGTLNYGSSFRIKGGETTSILEHPWMVFISSKTCDSPMNYDLQCISFCGGSVITNRFVLSAAHCEFNQHTTAVLGGENGIHVPVESQIRHPNYVHNLVDPNYDICLYRLARAVTYTDYIRPICLPTNYNFLAQTRYMTVTGWGNTENEELSNVLKKATLMQLDRSACSAKVDASQICAGAPNSHSCFGDSGGPVSAVYPIGGINRAIQLGIVSYVFHQCQALEVHTNVYHYMDWITNVVRKGGSLATPAPNYNFPSNIYPNNNAPVYQYPPNYVYYG